MCLKCEPCRSETATGTWTLRLRRASDSKRINPAPVRMPLRLNIRRKLTARSDRVKSVDVHPDEPWILCRWVALCHVDDSRDCAVSDPCFLGPCCCTAATVQCSSSVAVSVQRRRASAQQCGCVCLPLVPAFSAEQRHLEPPGSRVCRACVY